jgi:pimeloyl-ACP methyl ester carboxylesterase
MSEGMQDNPTSTKPSGLASEQAIIELPIAKRRAAFVSLPIGATEKKPVLVAAHGRDDYPRPLCEMFRTIVEDRAFVVCPTGVASPNLPGAFTYDTYNTLAEEIDDALAALAAKFPDHVDTGPIVYAGFSLGSYQGVRVVSKNPERTPRVILIEGGHDPWDDALISTFADNGGQRVLFVSGQDVNEQRSQQVARELSGAGIATKVVHAGDVGHVYTGPVREQLASAFDWVVEGDERWKK